MRSVLIAVFALGFCLSAYAAEGGATPAPAPDAKAVNTICPVTGDKVDPNVPAVAVKTKDGKTVLIGVCCTKCPAAIQKDPDKYLAAALANQKWEAPKK